MAIVFVYSTILSLLLLFLTIWVAFSSLYSLGKLVRSEALKIFIEGVAYVSDMRRCMTPTYVNTFN